MKTGEAKNMKIRTYKLELSDADAKKKQYALGGDMCGYRYDCGQ